MSGGKITTVFFDVGGTLLHVDASVGVVYSETARQHGIEAPAEDLDRRFRVAWAHSAERGRARGYVCSDALLRDEWFEIVSETFGDHVPPERLDGLFEELYERFSTASAWKLAPGTRENIECLRNLGVRLGVLSNWDSRLLRMLESLKIRKSFDVLVVSHAVGYEKPHPEIFREALRRAGVGAAEALHVGDSYEADIRPARNLGIRTLWVAPAEERGSCPEGGPGVDRLPEAPGLFWEEFLSRGE